MAITTTEAIVLRAIDYGETSRILTLLTPQIGVQGVLAKGARRPKSRFSPALEPFAIGQASLSLKHGRDLQTLTAFDLTHRPRGLGSDLLRFGGASLLAEIVLRTASEEPHPGLFATFATAIGKLEYAPADTLEPTILAEAWYLLGELGFAPTVTECARCGRPLDPREDAFYDASAGGLSCARCATGSENLLPAHARADLLAFTRRIPAPVSRTAGHWRILARHLEHHVLDRTPLRSLDFLADALARRA